MTLCQVPSLGGCYIPRITRPAEPLDVAVGADAPAGAVDAVGAEHFLACGNPSVACDAC